MSGSRTEIAQKMPILDNRDMRLGRQLRPGLVLQMSLDDRNLSSKWGRHLGNAG